MNYFILLGNKYIIIEGELQMSSQNFQFETLANP